MLACLEGRTTASTSFTVSKTCRYRPVGVPVDELKQEVLDSEGNMFVGEIVNGSSKYLHAAEC